MVLYGNPNKLRPYQTDNTIKYTNTENAELRHCKTGRTIKVPNYRKKKRTHCDISKQITRPNMQLRKKPNKLWLCSASHRIHYTITEKPSTFRSCQADHVIKYTISEKSRKHCNLAKQFSQSYTVLPWNLDTWLNTQVCKLYTVT
jgi:hypothetical protein